MEKVLVTGGAGFIGSHLCERLINKGFDVYSLDNYSAGTIENHINGVTYIVGDTNDISSKIKFSPSVVYHLGEYSRVEQSFHEIDKVHKSNVTGTFEVVKFCLYNDCKIIYAGSSTKFSDNGKGRFQSPYGWTKANNADLVMNFARWFGLKYAITYFYNAYGPREISVGSYATLIAKFRQQMICGQRLQVVMPGTQVRNFTHVYDIVSGIELVGQYGDGDGYGIGSDESYSVLQVADLFGGDVDLIDERPGNRLNADLHTEKIKAMGWKARYNLSDYIKQIKKTDQQSYSNTSQILVK